jgi:hypothetical protein
MVRLFRVGLLRPTRSFDSCRPRQRGVLTTELVVAMSILLVAVLPLGFSFLKDQKMCRIYYVRAIATEIIDGEMEILAAGAWRQCPEGTHPWKITAQATPNLPPGRFLVTRQQRRLTLEWVPDKPSHGGRVAREASLP